MTDPNNITDKTNDLPVRGTVRKMHGYVPGEQPAPGVKVIKLNTNENPFPPSPKVAEALRTFDAAELRKYPNPTADGFRDVAARLFGVTRDHIIAGNGSDDILTIAVRTLCGPGEVLAYPDPTYSLYPVLADLAEVKVAHTPWLPGWDLPVDDLLALKPRAIFFANPNAPIGSFVPTDRIRTLARRFDGVVLVDEAYVDFADDSALALVQELPNVFISRTLSKAYSLAGLRFGFGIGAPALIAEMMKVKDSYNCDAVSIALATAALQDQPYARQTWAYVRAERARLSDALTARAWQVIPSQTNFLLAAVPGGDAGATYRALKQRGILVRYFDKPGLNDKLRITIGTREENDALLDALDHLTLG